MTDAPAQKYTARPVGDGSGLWELVDATSGQLLWRASERLVKAKLHQEVNYEAQGHGRGRPVRKRKP